MARLPGGLSSSTSPSLSALPRAPPLSSTPKKRPRGLRVWGRSPTRGALRSPELLRRAQARGQGHGVCSPDRWGWSDRPTHARAPLIRGGGGAARGRLQLRPGAAATCVRACAVHFPKRRVTQELALRMRPFSVLLKPGNAGALIVRSPGIVTFVSQDLKVIKGKSRPP